MRLKMVWDGPGLISSGDVSLMELMYTFSPINKKLSLLLLSWNTSYILHPELRAILYSYLTIVWRKDYFISQCTPLLAVNYSDWNVIADLFMRFLDLWKKIVRIQNTLLIDNTSWTKCYRSKEKHQKRRNKKKYTPERLVELNCLIDVTFLVFLI